MKPWPTHHDTVETDSARREPDRTVMIQLALGHQRDEELANLKSHARRLNARGMPCSSVSKLPLAGPP